jgi:hypothetical protein
MSLSQTQRIQCRDFLDIAVEELQNEHPDIATDFIAEVQETLVDADKVSLSSDLQEARQNIENDNIARAVSRVERVKCRLKG